MTTPLQDGATWLSAKLKESGGRSVSYRRAGNSSTITLTPGMHRKTVMGDDDLITELMVYTWTAAYDDLPFGDPKPGDQITETIGGDVIVYEVLPPDQASSCFDWKDSSRIMVTLYSQRVT